jgi:hypothetical protein
MTPRVKVPRRKPCTAATASMAARADARVRRASASSAPPAAVSSTRRVVRVNKCACSSRSRDRMVADSPDCAT